MKLLESYALSSGQSISKPQIREQYYPLNIDKYITFHGTSKDSKTYSYWNDVLFLIKPVLEKEGIKIVELGAANDPLHVETVDLRGKTSLCQSFYVIKHGLLHLSVDSYTAHVAGIYDKKLVCLYANNRIHNVSPYFGNKENQTFLEPDRSRFIRPSFALQEIPRSIDTIQPEVIAAAVCKLLNLEFVFPYETLYTGNLYHIRQIEGVPDQAVDLRNMGTDTLILRMDLNFSEEFLFQQSQLGNVIIVTNKTINIELLKAIKPKIKEFIYLLDENESLEFAMAVQHIGFPFQLHSFLTDNKLNDLKFKYMDMGAIIARKNIQMSEIKQLKDKDINNLYYRSNKNIISKSKIYTSAASYKNNSPVTHFGFHLEKVIDSQDFWRELDYCTVLEKV